MAPKNKYVGKAKLPQQDFIRLVRYFAAGMEAARIAEALGVSRNTVNAYVRRIRERIVEEACVYVSPCSIRDHAPPGAFFVVRSLGNGTRSRRAGRALLHGCVHGPKHIVVDVQNGREGEVMHALLDGRFRIEGQVFAGDWRVFSGAMDSGVQLEPRGCKTLGVMTTFGLLENFLETTRSRLEKFRGVRHALVRLHIKESEFRFNYGADVERILLEMLGRRPL